MLTTMHNSNSMHQYTDNEIGYWETSIWYKEMNANGSTSIVNTNNNITETGEETGSC